MSKVVGEYQPPEKYLEVIQAFHSYSGMLLFAFARQNCSTKDIIIRNFLARTTMLRGIGRLWEISDHQDCWILHRCLMDRLFHLNHLSETQEFKFFEEWSFFTQFNDLNRLFCDPEVSDTEGVLKDFRPTSEQKDRYKKLSKSPPKWKRPKAEDVAKKLDMRFLYFFGYDYGSRHVHPMADDGQQDFFTITKLQPSPEFPDQRSVLTNSILIATMIVQEGLNASSFRWRAIVYNFLTHVREFLEQGTELYVETLIKLGVMVENSVAFCASDAETTA